MRRPGRRATIGPVPEQALSQASVGQLSYIQRHFHQQRPRFRALRSAALDPRRSGYVSCKRKFLARIIPLPPECIDFGHFQGAGEAYRGRKQAMG